MKDLEARVALLVGAAGCLAGCLATGEGVSGRQWVGSQCLSDSREVRLVLHRSLSTKVPALSDKNQGYCTWAESTVLIDG